MTYVNAFGVNNDLSLGNKTDDVHFARALGADKRVCSIDFLDEAWSVFWDLTVAPILNRLHRSSIILPFEEVMTMVNRLRFLLIFCTVLSVLLLSFYKPAQADWKADWEKALA